MHNARYAAHHIQGVFARDGAAQSTKRDRIADQLPAESTKTFKAFWGTVPYVDVGSECETCKSIDERLIFVVLINCRTGCSGFVFKLSPNIGSFVACGVKQRGQTGL